MPSSNLTPSTDDFMRDVDAAAPDPNVDTTDERKLARLSKTRQWKQVLEYIEARKEAYRHYLPGMNPSITGTEADWRVADGIIKELTALTNFVDEIATGVTSK